MVKVADDKAAPLLPQKTKVGGLSKGLLAMITSSFLFSLMALLVKFLKRFGTFELVFWRSIFMCVGTMAMLAWRKVNPMGKPGQQLILWLRGIAGFGFMGGYYYSIKYLPLSDAVVITYTSPVITAIVAAIILGEAWERIDAAGSLLCMTGVVMVSKPSFIMQFFGAKAEPLPLQGVLGAVCAALLSSSVYILLRYGKDLDPIVSTNYFAVAGIIISPIFCVLFGETWLNPVGAEWPMLFLLAGLSIVGQALMNIGLALESAGKATAMNYVQVVFAYLFQVGLLNEPSDTLSIIGSCLIASWGVIALVKDARKKKAAAAAEEEEEAADEAPPALKRTDTAGDDGGAMEPAFSVVSMLAAKAPGGSR